MHSLGIVQWNSTRRDHPGNPVGVSGSGPVIVPWVELPVQRTLCPIFVSGVGLHEIHEYSVG